MTNGKTATGAVLESDIYNGETYDARLDRVGWSEAGTTTRMDGRHGCGGTKGQAGSAAGPLAS